MQETEEMRHTSLFDVIRDLRDDIRSLIQDEIQLAKAEISEKVKKFGKNAVWLAVGGVLGYSALLIFLASLGALLAWAYSFAGLSNVFSWFLGLITVAIFVGGAGGLFALKAIKTFSQESIKPERTVETINTIRGAQNTGETTAYIEAHKPPPPSQEELQSHIHATRSNMEKRVEELSERLKPGYMGKRFVRQVRAHPIRSSIIGAGTGLASYLAIKRRTHNHEK